MYICEEFLPSPKSCRCVAVHHHPEVSHGCCVLLRSSFSRLLVDCFWGKKLIEIIDMSPFATTKPICDTKMTRFPSYSGAGIIIYQTMRFYINIANDLERPQIPFICLFGFFHLFFLKQVLD